MIQRRTQRRRKFSGDITAPSVCLPFHFEKLEPEWTADSVNQFLNCLQRALRLR